MKKMRLKAFTMAEAILVMTILGIIATIMITTLKPAQFKDKGLEIMARKVLSEIDTAVTQILINDTTDGTLHYDHATSCTPYACPDEYIKLFKKYLATTRQEVSNNSYCKTNGATAFYLKDGACIGYASAANNIDWIDTIFPGEKNATPVCVGTSPTYALILLYVDTNGDDEPNVFGKDQFALPVGEHGIMYDED